LQKRSNRRPAVYARFGLGGGGFAGDRVEHRQPGRAGPQLSVRSVTWKRDTAEQLSAHAGVGSHTVYNLTVEDDHTYFVGTTGGGTWVHNGICDNKAWGEAVENEWRDHLQTQGIELEPKTSVEANGPDAIRTGGHDPGWDYAELKPGNPQGRADGWNQLATRPGEYPGQGALYQYYGKPGSFNSIRMSIPRSLLRTLVCLVPVAV